MTRIGIALAVAALLAAHGPKQGHAARPVDPEGGVVLVYANPFGAAARRLTLRVESFAALRDDGSAVPLELQLPELSADTLSRQRLLAWGVVPRGNYTGFAIKVASARAREDDRVLKFAVPDEPTPSRFPFSAAASRATLLTVDLDSGASRGAENLFTPVFAPSAPSKLATGLIGVAASRASGVVTLFDKVSGLVAGAIAVGRGPAGMALDPLRNRLYVALANDDAVATVDLRDGTLLSKFLLREGDEPVSLALSADRRTLLAANAGSSTVSVLDAASATLFERTRVQVGNGPRYVLIDPAGTRAWVFNALDDSISVLAFPGGGTIGTIPSGGGPIRGEFGRAGARLYVIHKSSPYLDVVDTGTLAVIQRVFVGAGARALTVDPKTGRIYLGFKDSGRLDIFDPNGFLPIDHLAAEGGPGHLTIDDEGNNLCVSIPAKGEVRIFRLVGKSMVARVDVADPVEVAMPGER